MTRKVNVGIIGCGNISDAYFMGCKPYEIFNITACADLDLSRAKIKAQEYEGVRVCTVDELLNDPEIEIVVNLTIPAAHASVNLAAISAGKHIHCEKPLATNRQDARRTLKAAKEKGVLVGCAPDTFLGAGAQTCRRLIDDGAIGLPVSVTAFMACHGHESWHPNPDFYGASPQFVGELWLGQISKLMK